MTEPLFGSAAPIFHVEGQLRGELARDIMRLEVEEDTSGLKKLSARFIAIGPKQGESNEDLLYLDGQILDFGKQLEVSLGQVPVARTVFKGVISAMEASFRETQAAEVAVFAEDRLMDFRMTRRMKTYKDMSDADIAQAIASEHGLTPEVDVHGPTYDVVQQWNMSDLAFLRERASLMQAEIWFADDTLYFKTRDKRDATELTLVQGNQLLVLDARADLAHQRTRIKVGGYDASAREAIDEEAGEDAISAETSGGRNGPSILNQTFGERVSYRVREAPLTSTEARDWARAEMLRRARAFVTVHGVTSGSADMVVGSRLRLERVGTPFEGGGYYVTRVCHSYDLTNGFRTRFEAERATIEGGA